jgi:uncharacterized protein involved in exopolysaccharide biosynthesis
VARVRLHHRARLLDAALPALPRTPQPAQEVRHMILLGYLVLGCMFAFVFALLVATSDRRR